MTKSRHSSVVEHVIGKTGVIAHYGGFQGFSRIEAAERSVKWTRTKRESGGGVGERER